MTNENEGDGQRDPGESRGLSPDLCAAVREGNTTLVRTLLAGCAEPNREDENGVTPLAWAAFAGDLEVVGMLLDSGADPGAETADPSRQMKPQERVVPMVVASIVGKKDAFARLARASKPKTRKQAGKRIEKFQRAQDKKKWKLDLMIRELHAAVDRDDLEHVSLLIEQGVDVNVGDDSWGSRPLDKACLRKNLAMVLRLLKAGANPDGYLGADSTPLGGAMTPEIARALLDAGADPNAPHYCGDTSILAGSITHKLPEVARLLIDAGADLDRPATTHGCPLSSALSLRSFEVTRLLIESGADVNNAPKNAWTPLMYAASGGNEEMVRLLLDRGADPNASDPQSKELAGRMLTALSLAREEGHAQIVALLRERGANG